MVALILDWPIPGELGSGHLGYIERMPWVAHMSIHCFHPNSASRSAGLWFSNHHHKTNNCGVSWGKGGRTSHGFGMSLNGNSNLAFLLLSVYSFVFTRNGCLRDFSASSFGMGWLVGITLSPFDKKTPLPCSANSFPRLSLIASLANSAKYSPSASSTNLGLSSSSSLYHTHLVQQRFLFQ